MPARDGATHRSAPPVGRIAALTAFAAALTLTLSACAGPRDDASAPTHQPGAMSAAAAPAGTDTAAPTDSGGLAMKLTSTAFDDGATIPPQFTCEGIDQSPPLDIAGVPQDARALALIVDDPDAPGGTFVHWLLWNVSADTHAIPGSVAPGKTAAALGERATQGTNSFGKIGYGGPCPPKGRGAHTYRFQLYALDEPLELPAGAKRDALDAALHGHVIAETILHGRFAR